MRHHNDVTRRAAAILEAVARAGGEIIVENPADRGDTSSPLFRWRWRHHVPIWLMPAIIELREASGAECITFPQCRLGGQFQKWTTLMASPRAAQRLAHLGHLECTHQSHARVAMGQAVTQAAEYPALMAETIAAAALDVEAPKLTQRLGNERAAELLERSFAANDDHLERRRRNE